MVWDFRLSDFLGFVTLLHGPAPGISRGGAPWVELDEAKNRATAAFDPDRGAACYQLLQALHAIPRRIAGVRRIGKLGTDIQKNE